MAYVLTSSEILFARSERDFTGFERSNRARIERELNVLAELPTAIKEHKWTDEGRREPFTVVLSATSGLQIAVIDGHI